MTSPNAITLESLAEELNCTLILAFQMTEKEFWTKYSRAEYLHSTKNVVAAAAEAAEDEELAVFLKRDDMLANEARRKVYSSKVFAFSLQLTFLNWNTILLFIILIPINECINPFFRSGV